MYDFLYSGKEGDADRRAAGTSTTARESVRNIRNDAIGVPPPAGDERDPRPSSIRSQDAAILEYAARNRLLRGPGSTAYMSGVAQALEAPPGGRMRRRSRRDAPRTAALAEGLYRRIAPPNQKYPLKAVVLIRMLLREGAQQEFVLEKYRTHAWACVDLGVPPMPFIPYLAELLEVFLLDAKAARRNGMARKRSIP